ncbi:hypothetical protein GCM10009111_08650 [Colwellia asteriadis]|uniref:Uncharacterized protein n=1 Tax=Colwellia asteriadis TaxID=517723 RepID=A0ABP3WDI8_9GAMM
MHAVAVRDDLLERRQTAANEAVDIWDNLTLAQKFSASSLTQFGYELAFIRADSLGCLAILLCNDNIATISKTGEIDTSPAISLRN